MKKTLLTALLASTLALAQGSPEDPEFKRLTARLADYDRAMQDDPRTLAVIDQEFEKFLDARAAALEKQPPVKPPPPPPNPDGGQPPAWREQDGAPPAPAPAASTSLQHLYFVRGKLRALKGATGPDAATARRRLYGQLLGEKRRAGARD